MVEGLSQHEVPREEGNQGDDLPSPFSLLPCPAGAPKRPNPPGSQSDRSLVDGVHAGQPARGREQARDEGELAWRESASPLRRSDF